MSSDELFERLMVGGGLRRGIEGQQRVFWGLWLRPLQWVKAQEHGTGAGAARQMWQRREGGASAAAARLCRAISSVSGDKRCEAFGGFQKNVLERGPKRFDWMVSKRFGNVKNVSATK